MNWIVWSPWKNVARNPASVGDSRPPSPKSEPRTGAPLGFLSALPTSAGIGVEQRVHPRGVEAQDDPLDARASRRRRRQDRVEPPNVRLIPFGFRYLSKICSASTPERILLGVAGVETRLVDDDLRLLRAGLILDRHPADLERRLGLRLDPVAGRSREREDRVDVEDAEDVEVVDPRLRDRDRDVVVDRGERRRLERSEGDDRRDAGSPGRRRGFHRLLARARTHADARRRPPATLGAARREERLGADGIRRRRREARAELGLELRERARSAARTGSG